MSVTRGAAKIHKWMALVAALPILAWFMSGLFIAFVPEEMIHGHGGHGPPALVDPAAVARPLAAALARRSGSVEKIEVRTMLGHPVALLSPAEGRPSLVDLATGRTISPIDRATAIAIARAEMPDAASVRAVPVTEPLRAYPGPLPAWRVDFADDDSTQVYVAADLGRVMAMRNEMFRVFDVMWSLHILNFRDPRGINTPWLWGSAGLALVVAITGILLLPVRLGLRRRTGTQRKNQAP
jgi:hypothetical protein